MTRTACAHAETDLDLIDPPTEPALPVGPAAHRDTWPAPYRIETSRLVLRCFDPRDAIGLAAIIERNRAQLAAELDLGDSPEPVEVMAARLLGFRRAFDAGHAFHYGIVSDDRTEPVGSVSIEPLGGSGLLIGYWIAPEVGGAGLASEAVAAIAQVAFQLGGARYLEARLRPDNLASRALVERLGFAHEATLPERAWVAGVLHDQQIWTLRPASSARSLPSLRAFDALGRILPALAPLPEHA